MINIKHTKIIFLLICLIFLSACQEKSDDTNDDHSKEKQFSGFVAYKSTDQANMLLVIKNIDQNQIKNYSLDELIEIASQNEGDDYNGMFFYVNEDIYSKTEIGQRVNIQYKGPIQESLPPKASIKKIDILKK